MRGLLEPFTINWGDIATWVTGIATIALFVVAFIQIRTERNARIRAEKQAEDSRKRSQAELISAWLVTQGMAEGARDGETVQHQVAWVAVNNESAQPVYQVVISLFAISQAGDSLRGEMPPGRACVAIVPPGRGYVQVGAEYGGMHRRPGIEIGFEDYLGQAWARRPWGELLPLDVPTVAHYRVMLPTSWIGLDPEIPDQKDWDPFSGVMHREEWDAMREMYRENGGANRGTST